MLTAQTIAQVRSLVGAARARGSSIGFVPTMGALHAGHASLIDAAAAGCDYVVVSIFVNPTQFGPGEDLAAYPRTPEEDRQLCAERGADLVFEPSVQAMYAPGRQTEVSVGSLAKALCGASRPVHFAGVCTVVAKLFNIVAPDKAFFGAKDFQQCAIIRRMTRDLDFPIEIVVCPTVREPDGLAMSSRNRYLAPEERRQAACLNQSLQQAAETIRASHPAARDVVAGIHRHLSSHAPLGRIDYLQAVDPQELTEVAETGRAVLIALAVQFGKARLIDNIVVDVK